MNEHEIRFYLNYILSKSQVADYYVLASDEVGQISYDHNHLPAVAIVNTGPRSSAGFHWLLFYIVPHKVESYAVYLFDSYGHGISKYPSVKMKNVILWNSRSLQAARSRVCGAYVLYVASLIKKGYKLSEITEKFPKRKCASDRLVVKFVNALPRRVAKFDCGLRCCRRYETKL
jgi:Adenovirus endoprotease